jgi:hypothetical protein
MLVLELTYIILEEPSATIFRELEAGGSFKMIVHLYQNTW